MYRLAFRLLDPHNTWQIVGMCARKRYYRLIAAILVVASVVGFAPSLKGPHWSTSCRPVNQTTVNGPNRFTLNSLLATDASVDREPEAFGPLLEIEIPEVPPLRLLSIAVLNARSEPRPIRRIKLLPSRADKQDPLV